MKIFRLGPLLAALGVIAPLGMVAGSRQPIFPYENAQQALPTGALDRLLEEPRSASGHAPTYYCSDAVFVRRVFIDLTGTLPRPADLRSFQNSQKNDKRARLIESLMEREEFNDYWTNKWADLLRVKAEFPINLWPNAVQAYHRWIYVAVAENRPLDVFARQLLTAKGSNFRVPAANFYRAVDNRTPEGLARAVALTFMGTRLEYWDASRQADLAHIFSRVTYKRTAEWKEEIVLVDPAAYSALTIRLPDGTERVVPAGEDPREAFAEWLVQPGNPWFARSLANRAWSWFFGRGLVHEADDLRPDNPAFSPALLDHLGTVLEDSGYDLRALFRTILNSATYQQSAIALDPSSGADAVFACYPLRRLDAEVLIDALDRIGGPGQFYSSPIPEPFTFVPEDHRTVELADGSITSAFLNMFGRPSRNAGLEAERSVEPSAFQSMYLLNSTEMHNRIKTSPLLRAGGSTRKSPDALAKHLYLHTLSRLPTEEELADAREYLRERDLRAGAEDLLWALLNTKEFLYRH